MDVACLPAREEKVFNYEVIICTFNGERFITEQLASIVGQTVKPDRIIISDDGSTDGTLERIKNFTASTAVKIEVRVRTGGIKGAEYNFLDTLKLTKAPYVFFSDQDDLWLKNKVDLYREALAKVQEPLKPMLVFSDAEVVNENLQTIHASFLASEKLFPDRQLYFQRLIFQNCIQGATIMINQALKEKVFLSDRILMHDWWLALIAAAFGQLIFIPEKLIKYRQHYCNTVGHAHYSFRHILQKLTNLRGVAFQNRRIIKQAHAFWHLYGEALPEEKKQFLYDLITSQRFPIWQYFLFRNRIGRTTKARTLSLYFLK